MKFNIKNRWVVLFLLMVAYTLSFMDRYVMNLLLDPIKNDLKLSDTKISLLVGASFALFYSLMGIPLGRLSDKKSRVKLIAAGVALWSLMTGTCGLAKNYLQLMLSRVGVGVGEAALSPSAYSLLSDYFPKRMLATSIGIYSSGIYLGAGLAYIVGGYFLKFFNAHGTYILPVIGHVYSWQMIFFLFGIPGLLVALVFLFVQEPERKSNPQQQSLTGFVNFLKHQGKPFLILCLAAAIFNICVYATGIWIPTFLIRVHHIPADKVGYFTGIGIMLFSPIGVIFGGRIADMLSAKTGLRGRLAAVITFTLLFLPASIGYTLMNSEETVLWALIPYAIFVSTGVATIAATVQEMVPEHFKGTATALLLFSQNIIGMGIGPTSVGLLNDYVFHSPLALGKSLAIVSFVSITGAAILFIYCRRKISITN